MRTRLLPQHPAAALVAALVVWLSVAATATVASSAGYELANTPPPLPEAMRHMGTEETEKIYGALPVSTGREAALNGETVSVNEYLGNDAGFAVPDTDGGYVWVPAPTRGQAPGFADARELKLKVRELAAQLVADSDPALRCMVAIPTSFVNQEDFTQSSPLGRFMAEQLLYEFSQRGFPVREFRLAPSVVSREGQGEFLLSRKVAPVSTKTSNALFVVGTYYMDRQAVFVNARLVRGNGTVLRTAQVMLPNSSTTRRMLAGSAKALPKGVLPIRDYQTTTQPTNLTPFDRGEDIH